MCPRNIAWANLSPPLGDAPGTPSGSGFTQVSVNEHFTSYLMYRSDVPGSIWVSLRYLTWGWDGVAKRDGDPNVNGGWEMVSSMAKWKRGLHPSHETTVLPQWNARYKDDFDWLPP